MQWQVQELNTEMVNSKLLNSQTAVRLEGETSRWTSVFFMGARVPSPKPLERRAVGGWPSLALATISFHGEARP
ncbi:MAG: hypothetical protein ABSC94_28765 [Polyangiaceae bacterium]|jgi:hypothetical protein